MFALLMWRPTVPTSIDGKPLATTVSDLFLTFPYSRLPSNPLLNFLMRPEVSLALCVAYLASKPALAAFTRALGIHPKSGKLAALVAAHNLVLVVFSGVAFINSWPIVLEHLWERGWEAVYCDQDGSLWANGLGGWVTIFYLSKYYEFADTWMLILKGKEPQFLQVYHHIGVVLSMWGGVVSHSTWLLIVLLLNSGIHTMMYTYFFIKTLYPDMKIPAARYLTSAQIIQFFIGVFYVVPIHFLGERCDSPASRFMGLCMQLYGVGLIALFLAFAAKKYKKQ